MKLNHSNHPMRCLYCQRHRLAERQFWHICWLMCCQLLLTITRLAILTSNRQHCNPTYLLPKIVPSIPLFLLYDIFTERHYLYVDCWNAKALKTTSLPVDTVNSGHTAHTTHPPHINMPLLPNKQHYSTPRGAGSDHIPTPQQSNLCRH